MSKILPIFFCFFFLLSACPTNAQTYQSVLENPSSVWSVIQMGYCDAICSEYFTVTDTVVINGTTYRELNTGYYLREDTVSGKLWEYNAQKNREYLVMDLSLSMGDTFMVYKDTTAVPYLVDSVYMQNGKKHVRITANVLICVLQEQIEFIEGTGPNASFFYQGYEDFGSVSYYLLCHTQGPTLIQGNTLFFDDCYLCDVGINQGHLVHPEVLVFPVPAREYLSIQVNSPYSYSFSLFDISGKEVVPHKLYLGTAKLYTGHLPSGIYLLDVELESGLRIVRKIFVE